MRKAVYLTGMLSSCVSAVERLYAMSWHTTHTRYTLLQNHQERSQAEQYLKVFGQSTEYISTCKVR